jgi:hypothetical protein
VVVLINANPKKATLNHLNAEPGEGLRYGLTLWRWVHGERGEGDIWRLRTRRFLWIFSGIDAGDGRGIRPYLFL